MNLGTGTHAFRDLSIALVLVCTMSATQLGAQQSIVTTTLPPNDEVGLGGGLVQGAYLGPPAGTRLCAAVFIDGLGYFVKPTVATRNIPIDPVDGSFSFDSTTGGCDDRWEILSLTVIPDTESCPAPQSSPTPGTFGTVLASRSIFRQPTGVEFDGEPLWAKDSGICTSVGPGSNAFRRDNVRTQPQKLVLETTDDGVMVTAAEVANRDVTGYGHYVHEITLPPAGLDPGTVLGIFSFDRFATTTAFNEVDFEIGDSLITGGNAQCIVQGAGAEKNIFTIPPTEDELTVVLRWLPGEFTCEIYSGHVADELHSASPPTPFETWTTTLNVPAPGPDTRMRINVWVDDPVIALPTEVSVDSIGWQSLPSCGLDLRETPTGTREILLSLGNLEVGALYRLSLWVFSSEIPFFEVPLPELTSPAPLIIPLPDLPTVFGIVRLQSTLVSPTTGVVCTDSLLYDRPNDIVLPE